MSNRHTRRNLIIGSAATGALGFAGLAIIGPRIATWITDTSVNSPHHDNTLAIPPLYEGEMVDGIRHFSLSLQEGETEFVPDRATATWGVNGSYLGPTLRASHGDTVQVDVHNELPAKTALHWHGMHLPAEMDGGPHQLIQPGEHWLPTWEVIQPAATLWYHPHPHGETADHTWKGIAGMFIICDDEDVALPVEYGIDDVPLVIQDRKFASEGNFDAREHAFGYFGDHILVNGTYGAVFEVTRSLTRFRILNGSNSRWYNLAFDDSRSFRRIAGDSGYIGDDSPELTSLLISPGERAEIVVEFSPGEDVMLRNVRESRWKLEDYGTDIDFDVIRFVAAGNLEDSGVISAPTVASGPDEPNSANRRRYTLNGHSEINGQEMDMSRIDEVIPAGAEEIWEVRSTNFASHNFHIHGVSFEVLEVDGEEPPAHQRGPKDTVQVLQDKTVTLRVKFPEYADEAFPYMYHCHILRHEDQGMMGQFLVVEPGREGHAPRTLKHAHEPH